MAVAALLLWLGTAAVGAYLLATALRAANAEPAPREPVTVPPEPPASEPPTDGAGPGPTTRRPAKNRKARAKDIFDPPSLQRAKSEPLPGLRELAEFAHPALAMIGVAFWLGYVVSHQRVFAVIGLGILLGAICAGLSWFAANTRAARRAASAGPAAAGPDADGGGGGGGAARGAAPLTAPTRLLLLHGLGAALTLLFAVWLAVRG